MIDTRHISKRARKQKQDKYKKIKTSHIGNKVEGNFKKIIMTDHSSS